MLPKRRSRQVSSVPWCEQEPDSSLANRIVDVPSSPAMRRPDPTCPDPPVVCPVFGLGRSFINHVSTAGQRLISFLYLFQWDLVCSCSCIDVQHSFVDSLNGKRSVVHLPDHLQTASLPIQPRPFAAPPCAAPTRPARSVYEFWIRKGVYCSNSSVSIQSCLTSLKCPAVQPKPFKSSGSTVL